MIDVILELKEHNGGDEDVMATYPNADKFAFDVMSKHLIIYNGQNPVGAIADGRWIAVQLNGGQE